MQNLKSSMPKVLFLLGKYYPKSSANGVCCKNIVDECKRQGMGVTCVINGDVTRPKHEFIDGVEVYRIKPRLYYRIIDWCEYHSENKWVRFLLKFADCLNKVQLGIMSVFWPLVSPMYTYRFYRQGKKLLLQQGDFDVLVAAYTPIDSAYAGYLLKKKFHNIKYVPYYLDALAGGWGPSFWSKIRIEKHTRHWETKINSIADAVISMQSAKEYHDKHPLPYVNRVYLDVPTFVVNNAVSTTKETKNIIVALYAGSINYPQRNPVPLLEAFASFDERYRIEFHLIGPCNCISLLEKYSKLSNGRIKYLGAMSRDEILKEEAEADFLVNIGGTNPYTIPSKIFEYMQFRKPVISSKSIDNDAALSYLSQYGSCFIFDERKDKQSSHAELLRYILSNPQVGNTDYSRVFYKNTPQAFCDTIRSLL